MDERLLSATVQKFIHDHKNDDERDLVLRHAGVNGVPMALIAAQIGGRKKAKEKLPSYASTPGVIFPPAVNLEQSSSEATAKCKAELLFENGLSTHSVGVDLTGGFGVDSLFFSRKAASLHLVEPDSELLSITHHNHQLLGARNITYHNATAEEFLDDSAVNVVDFIYIDPGRRLKGNQKIFRLSDSLPNIIALQPLVHEKSSLLMIKASPLMDIALSIDELLFVKKVFVVALQNECKEVIFLCERGFEKEPDIIAIDIRNSGEKNLFSFKQSEEKSISLDFAEPMTFIYEPNAAILKSGAFKSVAARFDIRKIHPSTHLYTSNHFIEGFPGRVFGNLVDVKADAKFLQQFFPDGKANITTRNYPFSVEELKKKTKLKDGGEKYLIGFSGVARKHLVSADRLK